MLWFFEKDGERLQCEIRPAADGSGIELAWTQAGETHREPFATGADAETRRLQLQEDLLHDGWVLVGGPTEAVLVAPYVLVVDDERSIRVVLRRRLQGWGYAVREASSATDALDVMRAEPASIVISDIRMPQHDGLWLLARIREQWPRTSVIMVTGADDMASIEKSRKLGAVGYVLKPFDRELLRQALLHAAMAVDGQ
ncbi:MAG: response regulator [Acidobacteria bacterium]|nr:MAG: response regulator [Acidobacteriota bacterium]